MLIAIAIIAAIILPVLYFLASRPDMVPASKVVNTEIFLGTMRKMILAGDLVRAVKLCTAAGEDVIFAEATSKMIRASNSGLHSGIYASACEKAGHVAERLRRFSLYRLVRDLTVIIVPIAIMNADDQGRGWVIVPLIISWILIALLAAYIRYIRIDAIRQLTGIPGALSEIRDLLKS